MPLLKVRIVWQRGLIGEVRAEICSRIDHRVAGRPWNENYSEHGGHTVHDDFEAALQQSVLLAEEMTCEQEGTSTTYLAGANSWP